MQFIVKYNSVRLWSFNMCNLDLFSDQKDIPKGMIHKSRQWDLWIVCGEVSEASYKYPLQKATFIPIQVMAEITGQSR